MPKLTFKIGTLQASALLIVWVVFGVCSQNRVSFFTSCIFFRWSGQFSPVAAVAFVR